MPKSNDGDRTASSKLSLPYRRSVRLKVYDYAAPGACYVTVCTRNREPLLGALDDGRVRLTRIGATVRDEWIRTPDVRPAMQLDAFVIMPNHFHAIAIISDEAVPLEELIGASQFDERGSQFGSPHRTIGSIIRGFKGKVTSRVRRGLGDETFMVWQSGFYEHVVQDLADLERIREYINENVARWAEDPYNPSLRKTGP